MIRQVELLHLNARPNGLAQKLERRFYTGVMCETADGNVRGQIGPTTARDQVFDDGAEGNAVQWIFWLLVAH